MILAFLARNWLYIAAGIAIVVVATAAYQYVDNNWATDAGIAEGQRRTQKLWDEAKTQQREEEIERGRKAALELGDDRAKSETITRTVTKYIDRIVDRPVYRSDCIDTDGLRYLNCAIRGEAGTASCGPDSPLPTTPRVN